MVQNEPGFAAEEAKEIDVKKISRGLIVGWVVALVLVLAWNSAQIKKDTQQEALIGLRMAVEKDAIFRLWATSHGGVYVPVTSQTQPNPDLEHIKDRDLTTTDGKLLTLLNPAYIMREVAEMHSDAYGATSRLTSSKAVNRVNTADYWEAEALKEFEKKKAEGVDIDEIYSMERVEDKLLLRLIRPFYIEEDCLKCHGHQGYQVGDLRGGITASVSLEPYLALMRSKQLALLPGYGLLCLMGVLGIRWLLQQLQIAALNLKAREASNRAMVQAIPDTIVRYNKDGVYLDAEIKGVPLLDSSTVKGQVISSVLPKERAKILMQTIDKAITSGELQQLQYSHQMPQGTAYFEERMVPENENHVVSIIRDITSQKTLQDRLEHLSFHDQLTGLYNRHYLESRFEHQKDEEEYPITFISMDVNKLKMINDSLGHAAGDRLLKECAKVLRSSVRSTDVLVRVGGDEIVAILIRANEQMGREVVNRIKTSVKRYNRHPDALPLSLSYGMATVQNPDDDIEQAYHEADALMYRQKRIHEAEVIDTISKALSIIVKGASDGEKHDFKLPDQSTEDKDNEAR